MPGQRSYKAVLDEAWTQHLAPRAADAPTVISTFAGCGGSSLGYSMAGFRELLAVEWDNNAVATFRRNFPDVPVYHGDIAKLSVERCLSLAGVQPGELDVLDGSPPCQGFSTAGKRILDDQRNGLFREFVRLLRGLRPRAFVMENVSGMVKGKMRLAFVEILRELKASGYRVVARLLNAKWFYVPQSRERLIFVGVRDDLGLEPSHPRPESGLIVFGEAIAELSDMKQLAYPFTANKMKNWIETDRGKSHYKRFSACKMSFSKVAPTVVKASGAGWMMHPTEQRTLAVGEVQRIASFPDAFVLSGGWKNAIDRIGNSVPPLFMRAIARHLRAAILLPSKLAPRLEGLPLTSIEAILAEEIEQTLTTLHDSRFTI